tara:strand:+ start:1154 stop:1999 length:846 start_codon:yes stop_codon:yes gene_type:complete
MTKKIAIFGANGFIGSSLSKYMIKKGCDILAISKSSNNTHNYDNYVSIDLTIKSNWPYDLINRLKSCELIIFCAAIAHKTKINPFDTNIIIIENFIYNFKSIQNLENKLIFLSTNDIQFIKDGFPERSNYFPYAYARSKLVSEKLLRDQINNDLIIIRLPLVYSNNNSKDLLKRCRITIGGIPLYFKILPSPNYKVADVKDVCEFIYDLETDINYKNNLIHYPAKLVTQYQLLSENSKLFFIIPKIIIRFLHWVFLNIPYLYFRERALNLQKLLDYDYNID